MNAKKAICSVGAVMILVFLVLFTAAAIFIALLTQASGAEKQPNATLAAVAGGSEIIKPGAYGIKMQFSDGKIESAGGVVEIHAGQIPITITLIRWNSWNKSFSEEKIVFYLRKAGQ